MEKTTVTGEVGVATTEWMGMDGTMDMDGCWARHSYAVTKQFDRSPLIKNSCYFSESTCLP